MSQKSTVVFRDFEPSRDVPLVLDLYNRTLERPRTLKDWEWEFQRGPGGAALGWVAEAKGRIVAHWSVIPLPLVSQGCTLMGGKGEFAVTDPSYQGTAVFPSLIRHALADLKSSPIQATWSFPNDTLCKIQQWIGYQLPTKLEYLLVVRRPGRMLREFGNNKGRLLQFAGCLLYPLDGILSNLPVWKRSGSCRHKIRVEKLDQVDERFDILWERVALTIGTTLVRDQAFLNWRFVHNPRLKHTILLATDISGGPLGYAILTDRFRGRVKLGEIVDLIFDPSRENVARALLDAATAELIERDVDAIRFFASCKGRFSQYVQSAAQRCGFRFRTAGARFSLMQTAGLGQNSSVDGDWYVTAAFTEGINY